jgi:hypothetical protein
MADALSMDVAAPEAGGGLFDGPAEETPAGEDALALGEADETELDPMFAADASELFPDLDDEQLTKLQKLIDSRMGAATAVL